jgi:hypothetical protein
MTGGFAIGNPQNIAFDEGAMDGKKGESNHSGNLLEPEETKAK